MIVLKEGGIYCNGRGDYFGPMTMARANLWLDQYDTAYATDGRVHNHTKDSMANLVAPVTIADVCRAHNELSEILAVMKVKP